MRVWLTSWVDLIDWPLAALRWAGLELVERRVGVRPAVGAGALEAVGACGLGWSTSWMKSCGLGVSWATFLEAWSKERERGVERREREQRQRGRRGEEWRGEERRKRMRVDREE